MFLRGLRRQGHVFGVCKRGERYAYMKKERGEMNGVRVSGIRGSNLLSE